LDYDTVLALFDKNFYNFLHQENIENKECGSLSECSTESTKTTNIKNLDHAAPGLACMEPHQTNIDNTDSSTSSFCLIGDSLLHNPKKKKDFSDQEHFTNSKKKRMEDSPAENDDTSKATAKDCNNLTNKTHALSGDYDHFMEDTMKNIAPVEKDNLDSIAESVCQLSAPGSNVSVQAKSFGPSDFKETTGTDTTETVEEKAETKVTKETAGLTKETKETDADEAEMKLMNGKKGLRKCPKQPAKDFSSGTILLSENDGRKYIVTTYTKTLSSKGLAQVKRWVLYR
jgi:hypothetical protein